MRSLTFNIYSFPDLSYRVTNLQDGKEYEFRVAAINAAGQGAWSSGSDYIMCQPPPSAPKITSDLSIRGMYDLPNGEKVNDRALTRHH